MVGYGNGAGDWKTSVTVCGSPRERPSDGVVSTGDAVRKWRNAWSHFWVLFAQPTV